MGKLIPVTKWKKTFMMHVSDEGLVSSVLKIQTKSNLFHLVIWSQQPLKKMGKMLEKTLHKMIYVSTLKTVQPTLTIREMQINAPVRYTPIRMATLKRLRVPTADKS